MHIHGAALHGNVGAPHHLQNGLAGHDKVGVLQQQPKQAVFFVGQVNAGPVHRHAVAGIVQQDLMERIHLTVSFGLRAAERRPHPAQKFHDAEGLADVIVGSAVQAPHGVQLAGFGRDHDDGKPPKGRGVAQLLQDGKAVFAGKHHVQDHKLGFRRPHGLPERLRRGKALHGVAVRLQGILLQLADGVVIFYDIDHCSFSSVAASFSGKR